LTAYLLQGERGKRESKKVKGEDGLAFIKKKSFKLPNLRSFPSMRSFFGWEETCPQEVSSTAVYSTNPWFVCGESAKEKTESLVGGGKGTDVRTKNVLQEGWGANRKLSPFMKEALPQSTPKNFLPTKKVPGLDACLHG